MHNQEFATILLAILPLLLAITISEATHGYVARHYGDHTAEMMGRLTLNPLKHIDLVGTIIVPMIIFISSNTIIGMPMIFGWAKPVPINSRNFHNPRIGIRMVSVSGPLINLIMSLGWAMILIISLWIPASFQTPLQIMSSYGISFNISLFVLNMIPILPLDGGRFIDTFLSPRLSYQYQKIEPYSMWIILLLLVSGVLGHIIQPIYLLIWTIIKSFIGLFY